MYTQKVNRLAEGAGPGINALLVSIFKGAIISVIANWFMSLASSTVASQFAISPEITHLGGISATIGATSIWIYSNSLQWRDRLFPKPILTADTLKQVVVAVHAKDRLKAVEVVTSNLCEKYAHQIVNISVWMARDGQLKCPVAIGITDSNFHLWGFPLDPTHTMRKSLVVEAFNTGIPQWNSFELLTTPDGLKQLVAKHKEWISIPNSAPPSLNDYWVAIPIPAGATEHGKSNPICNGVVCIRLKGHGGGKLKVSQKTLEDIALLTYASALTLLLPSTPSNDLGTTP